MPDRLPLRVPMTLTASDLEPKRGTPGAAGIDLRAAEEVCLGPGQRVLVRTGVGLAIPQGFEGQVRPRSGLALGFGVTVLNAPGTIDSDYRGEVKVILVNTDPKVGVTIKRGDRIAQLVIAPVTFAELVVVDSLDETERGAGGFGSTGR